MNFKGNIDFEEIDINLRKVYEFIIYRISMNKILRIKIKSQDLSIRTFDFKTYNKI